MCKKNWLPVCQNKQPEKITYIVKHIKNLRRCQAGKCKSQNAGHKFQSNIELPTTGPCQAGAVRLLCELFVVSTAGGKSKRSFFVAIQDVLCFHIGPDPEFHR